MLVRDIMTADPACCTSDTGLREVAQLMAKHDCGCIPVVEDQASRVPVGVVTDRDITLRTVAAGKNPIDLTAGDIMTPSVVAVTADTTLEDCCNLMEDKQIRRIAVVDDKGGCCGIIAQADIAINAGDRKTAEVVQEVSKTAAA